MCTNYSGIQHVDKNGKREKLQETLCQYTSNTLSLIATVSEFCLSRSKWSNEMTANITKVKDIKERAIKAKSIINQIKGLKNKLTIQEKLDRTPEELEQELVEASKDIIEGLEKLNKFVDAVETLAVTSPHVFEENSQVLQLPEGTSLKSVQAVITAAIQVCPLLLQLKRDAHTFFSPSFHNVEVHSAYLVHYINITEMISNKMEDSSVREFEKMKKTTTVVQLPAGLSEDDIQDMLHRIEHLIAIRKDQHFRVGFMFQDDSSSAFVKEFSERETGMLQFLTELEETAIKLDRMKKGAQISNVAGSSVGVVSGVLGIVGLALIPFTAGASLVLTMVSVGLGATSAVNSIVTTSTEIGVNKTQQKKAENLFQKFKEDMEALQVFLEEVSCKELEQEIVKVVFGTGIMVNNARTAGMGIKSVVRDSNGLKVLKGDQLMFTKKGTEILRKGKGVMRPSSVATGSSSVTTRASSVVTRSSSVASEIPELGQATVKGTLALSKTARAGLIGLNVFFIGWDVYSIVTGSMDLLKGIQSEASQSIRARASLFCSVLDSWKKIHDSLSKGMTTSEEKKKKLEWPFYPS